MVDLKIQLPEDFLDEEVRCDYLITSEIKKVWAVMLDLLMEVDRICKEYNVRYFASGGTLLGAIRHKGFIPWDDDLDIYMLRDDYEKFSQIASSALKSPYFFQTKFTDPYSSVFIGKIRNSSTTALTKSEMHSFLNYNKGIFIDVFPLDEIPDDERELDLFMKELHIARQKVYRVGRMNGIFSEAQGPIGYFVKKSFHKMVTIYRKRHIADYLKSYRHYISLVRKYNGSGCKRLASLTWEIQKRDIILKENLSGSDIDMDFEFVKIPVPQGYDNILRSSFGNYEEFKIYPHHSSFFDTDNSYHHYQ